MGQADILKILEKEIIVDKTELLKHLNGQWAGIAHAIKQLKKFGEITIFTINAGCVRRYYVKNDLYNNFFSDERQEEVPPGLKRKSNMQGWDMFNNIQQERTNKSVISNAPKKRAQV